MALVAFCFRLVSLLRGSGLHGLGRYDDGVYFAAAVAFVHRQFPYRDFLLLHPPGIVVALSPFAALGLVTNEGTGLAAARIGWMLLGAAGTALVVFILRPVGRFAAVLGGFCYAVFPPALQAELGTQLQGPSNTCLLLALLLLTRRPGPSAPQILAAGFLLGFAVTIKVWGAVTLLLLAGWLLVDRSRGGAARRAALLLAGAGLTATAVCLPFFVAAPTQMWHQVVTAQVTRARFSSEVGPRLLDILGLPAEQPDWPAGRSIFPLLAVALLMLAALVLAWSAAAARPAVILAVGLGMLLLSTPPWFPFYAALTAPPVALVVGAGGQRLVRLVAAWASAGRRSVVTMAVGASVLVLVGGYAVASANYVFGRPFAGAAFARGLEERPGCVTSDTPAALVAMNVLGRNIERGCRLVIDPGGYSYLLHPEQGNVTRHLDPDWQEFVLTYLRSGDAAIVATYRLGSGFSAGTVTEIERWPTLLEAGRHQLRTPLPP